MWSTEDAIRVAEGARDTNSEVPITAAPIAFVQNDVTIWLDIAARLKSKMTWPFGERQPVETKQITLQGGQMSVGSPQQQEVPDYTPKYAWLLRARRGSDVAS